jgi:adenosylhomocysteine nucleosidase
MKTYFNSKIILILCIFSLLSTAYGEVKKVTGILGAMPVETAIINKNISDKKTVNLLGIKFTSGTLKGRSVVTAVTGVGKVNSSMVATLMLYYFKPAEVIFTGIAGGINTKLHPGDIIIGDKLAQYDLGEITDNEFKPFSVKNPVNQKQNPLFMNSDKKLIDLTEKAASKITFESYNIKGKLRKPVLTTGCIATGDKFVASAKKTKEISKLFDADACEMEGASVAQICYQQNIPFIVIRSLSDNANEDAGEDIKNFTDIASKNSANLTIALVEEIAKSQ